MMRNDAAALFRFLLAAAPTACVGSATEPPVPQDFAVVASLPEPRYDAAVAQLSDGRVIVIGGADLGGRIYSSSYLFDPATHSLHRTRCNLIIPRRRAVAARLSDGQVIVLGGDTGNLYTLVETEIYDPATDCFAAGPTLQERRSHVNGTPVVLPDGRLLVILGAATSWQATWCGGAEILDPDRNAFRVLDRDLGRSTSAVTVTPLLGGRVLLTGGMEPDTATGLVVPTDRAVLFDPVTDTFRELGARLTVAREFHASASLPDGRALLFGGGTGIGSSIIEEFDPVSETIRRLPVELETARVIATALTVSPNLVMVIGGKTAFGRPPEKSTELLNYETLTVSRGPDLPTGVGMGHVSFLIPGQGIVIFRPAGDPPTDSVAVFIASTR